MFFPGVPRELIRMIREEGIPRITERFGLSARIFKNRTMHVYGLSESKLGEILSDVAKDEEGFHLSFLPRFPIIRLRLDAMGNAEDTPDAILDTKQSVIKRAHSGKHHLRRQEADGTRGFGPPRRAGPYFGPGRIHHRRHDGRDADARAGKLKDLHGLYRELLK